MASFGSFHESMCSSRPGREAACCIARRSIQSMISGHCSCGRLRNALRRRKLKATSIGVAASSLEKRSAAPIESFISHLQWETVMSSKQA